MGVKYIEDINDEEMDKWIGNLRSGEFTQTHGLLYRKYNGGMCCLGVQAVGAGAKVDNQYSQVVLGGNYYDFLPPKQTIAKLNLPERYLYDAGSTASIFVDSWGSDGGYRNDKGMTSVTSLNDNLGCSFNEIADRLEDTFIRKEYKNA